MRAFITGLTLLAATGTASLAQVPAPPAGSDGGGPVGPSIAQPTVPTGRTPPGTPTGTTPEERGARDAVGQSVIGKTATPPSAVPGNTGGGEAAPGR